MQKNLRELIDKMTLEEKATLCSGLDNWHTVPIERLGIPSVMMTDGPHGVRKETGEPGDDPLSSPSYPATCFPTAAALACSWDTDLMTELGEALGEECLASGVSILLGPGVNIKRSPLCGRNFEYFSEDPFLAGKMAAGFINGVQKKGIGVSLKHFAANNQETNRLTVDAIANERTLREIYLANFETAVKEAKPWTVMCSYNKLNGEYCSENTRLLTDILRREWGFDGLVMSDWGAVNERDDALNSGLDLEMPYGGEESTQKIVSAVKCGKLSEETLDAAVMRVLEIVFKGVENTDENFSYDVKTHNGLARQIEGECIVLLKNEGVLPLRKSGSIAVIGAFAESPRYQGGGSSHMNPTILLSPLDEIRKLAGDDAEISYSQGYPQEEAGSIFGYGFGSASDVPDDKLINEAVAAAAKADHTVIFAGLPDSFESEGYDRTHMSLPQGQIKLIEEVSKSAKNVIVVLMNGSPVEMPWIDGVSAVLEAYLGGQACGGAVADVLFGRTNPSGKLAETFPMKLSDNPSYLFFPGEGKRTEYREGIFVGYRYYEKKQIAPLFPFGYGLSYTKFEYTDIEGDKKELDDTDTLTVNVKVKSTGKAAGKEIVQLYVRDSESSVLRPEKELKGFKKVSLNPGEEKSVSFVLDKRAFAYYDELSGDWLVETGDFEILAGGSSADTPLQITVKVNSTATKNRTVFTRNSTVGEVLDDPTGYAILCGIAGEELVNMIPPFVRQMPLRSIHTNFPDLNEEAIAALTDALNS